MNNIITEKLYNVAEVMFNGIVDDGNIAHRSLIEMAIKPSYEKDLLERKNDYLNGIAVEDRINYYNLFVGIALALPNCPFDIAILAVGSSTRPSTKSPHDIDFRILNSEPTDSKERENAVAIIQHEIENYLTMNGLKYKFRENTTTIPNKSDKHIFGYWDNDHINDSYNKDPSFIVSPPKGLPMHISISGVDNPELTDYLELEEYNNSTAVVLFSTKDHKDGLYRLNK